MKKVQMGRAHEGWAQQQTHGTTAILLPNLCKSKTMNSEIDRALSPNLNFGEQLAEFKLCSVAGRIQVELSSSGDNCLQGDVGYQPGDYFTNY